MQEPVRLATLTTLPTLVYIIVCCLVLHSGKAQEPTDRGQSRLTTQSVTLGSTSRHMKKSVEHCHGRLEESLISFSTEQMTAFGDHDLEVLNLSNSKIVQIPGINERRMHPIFTPISNTRPEGMSPKRWAVITIPEQHLTFVSLTYLNIQKGRQVTEDMLLLLEIMRNSSEKRLWGFPTDSDDELPMVVEAEKLKVLLTVRLSIATYGFIFVFSYHKKSMPMLERLSSGKWNCSVPHWPDFDAHFRCDLSQECNGGEDEMGCPYSGSCGVGRLTINGRCYWYMTSDKRLSWYDAQSNCARQGGYLASLNTRQEWNDILRIMDLGNRRRNYYVGLQDSSSNLPSYYVGTYRWADRSLAIYVRTCHSTNVWYLSCGFVRPRIPNTIQISIRCHRPLYNSYLCEASDPALSVKQTASVPQVRIRSPYQPSLPVPHVQCPTGHFTHSFLACDPQTVCWGIQDLVYIDASSDIAGRLSRASCPTKLTSLPPSFQCRTEQTSIAYSLVCDGLRDCSDGSDEDFCRFPDCGPEQLLCAESPLCLSIDKICDGQKDCHKGNDEIMCEGTNPQTSYRDMTADYIPSPAIVNFNATQWWYYLHVTAKTQGTRCPETHFHCQGHDHCLPVYMRCNGLYDCPDHEDEANCGTYQCPGFYNCRASMVCVHGSHVCDGLYQCPQKDDELFCHLRCPPECTCHGLAFVCAREFSPRNYTYLKYLDGSHSGMTPYHLLNNKLLVFLSLANCGLNHLDDVTFDNLRILDVSYNIITNITVQQLAQMVNLATIVLSGNPLAPVHLFQDVSSHSLKSITFLHLANTRLTEISSLLFKSFPNLQKLNLSNSGVIRIVDDGLTSVKNLHMLDVRGCPLTYFPDGLTRNMHNLRSLFTDNYKLCCRALLPKGFNLNHCHAPNDEISSCDALLRSNVYRMMLSIFATFSVLGNLASFLIRMFWFKATNSSSFVIFVSHLCISDFIMGVYLAMIGVADHLFLDSYLWKDVMWRHSLACKVAGFLSLLSSEVSALVVCFITLDRFLVLRFPFSSFKFSKHSSWLVCAMIWLGCFFLAAVPLLEVTHHWHFYSQTGICIPLPITTKTFPGHTYAFGIIIVFNFILFLLIATGQIFIFHSIRANRMAITDTTRKAQDQKIARRLIIIAASDFLCWFPIGVLGLLASQGMFIPGEVNVAMAILVLPLNSTLNPFLYNLNMLLEKRRRVRQEKWLNNMKEMIMKEQLPE